MAHHKHEGPKNVAQFLAEQIERSGKSKLEIAKALGYEDERFVEMMMQGLVNVPLPKATALAQEIGIEPSTFIRRLLSEYMPESWSAIREAYSNQFLTENEALILEVYRGLSNGSDQLPMLFEKNGAVVMRIIRGVLEKAP